MQIKLAAPEDRDAILEAVSFLDHLPTNASQDPPSQLSQPRLPHENVGHPQADLRLGPEGSLIYHGPTSIHRVQSDGINGRGVDNPGSPSMAYLGSESNFEHVLNHFEIDIQDEVITDVLMLFFKWQYPHFMFIYREAFLRDHFGDRRGSTYWSSALLLAICALGTLMRPDSQRREMSERFFAAAESIILVSGLTHPTITTVQTFLCLAFYEIGRSNLSKGWGYSGTLFLRCSIDYLTYSPLQALPFGWPKTSASSAIQSIGSLTTQL